MAAENRVRAIRDWQGIKYHLATCTTEELQAMAETAFDSANQITAFVEQIQTELGKRGESLPNPYDVA